MNNFYVTLPSNIESKYFDNNLGQYRTKLASPLKLDGDWEVGLSSISFTNSWFNIPETEKINFLYFDGKGRYFDLSATLIKNNYNDITSLLKQLNAGIAELENELKKTDAIISLPTFLHVKDFEIICCELKLYKNCLVFPEMSDNLCKILGFDKKSIDSKRNETYRIYKSEFKKDVNYIPKIENKEKILWGYNMYEIFAQFHSMYVYCDIINDSFIGDKQAPLLRYVEIPTKAKYGEQVVKIYTDLHYIPLRSKEFDSILLDMEEQL